MKLLRLLLLFMGVLGLLLPLAAAGTQPPLNEVMSRVGTWVQHYEARFSNILAREKYRQVSRQPFQSDVIRNLESDVLMVLPETDGQYKMFRDVYKVNGSRVRDRQDRLQKLFVESPGNLSAIAAESSRYNIGAIERNFNVPTTVLYFLLPEIQPHFHFEKAADTEIDGEPAWEIRFEEQGSPTLIRYNYRDIAARGSIWVNPDSGRIMKTRLELEHDTDSPKAVSIDITVTYRIDPRLELPVPDEMREQYQYPVTDIKSRETIYKAEIEGRAVYSHYRRFVVETDNRIDERP